MVVPAIRRQKNISLQFLWNVALPEKKNSDIFVPRKFLPSIEVSVYHTEHCQYFTKTYNQQASLICTIMAVAAILNFVKYLSFTNIPIGSTHLIRIIQALVNKFVPNNFVVTKILGSVKNCNLAPKQYFHFSTVDIIHKLLLLKFS